jgi:hypothetical protein
MLAHTFALTNSSSAFTLRGMILSLHTVFLTILLTMLFCTTVATPLSALSPQGQYTAFFCISFFKFSTLPPWFTVLTFHVLSLMLWCTFYFSLSSFLL